LSKGKPPSSIFRTSNLLRITSRLREVQFPRKFRPREDFPPNRSSKLENPNRAGEIYRAEEKIWVENSAGLRNSLIAVIFVTK